MTAITNGVFQRRRRRSVRRTACTRAGAPDRTGPGAAEIGTASSGSGHERVGRQRQSGELLVGERVVEIKASLVSHSPGYLLGSRGRRPGRGEVA